MDEFAIRVNKVSKNFRLPHEKVSSIKSLFVNPFKLKSIKNFEIQHALKDISFDVKKGEFFGIVGRNGSGKSTLLKILAGIYQPNSGKVTVNGRLVPFIELGVGFNPELTGRENVYLNGALLGFSRQEIEMKYEKIVDFAELERFMDQKLKNYSSGMQVRLAFSVATILAESEILLIDEVLAVGDMDFQRKCFDYFETLKKEGKTVIFVSHDMEAIRRYCDKAILIDGGVVKKIGGSDEIGQEYIKLFNKDKITKEPTEYKAEKKWGDGSVTTKSINLKVHNDLISVRHNLTAKRNLVDFIPGIRIRASDGSHLTGTNIKIEKIKIQKVQSNQDFYIEWYIPNVFSDGKYYVDLAVISSDGVGVYEWWDEAKSFNIKKPRMLPYPLDLDIKVESDIIYNQ